jgi:hypothetical protein
MTKLLQVESSTAKVRKSDPCDRAWYQTNPLIVADNLVPSDSRITSPFIISAGDQSLYLWSRARDQSCSNILGTPLSTSIGPTYEHRP